MIILAFYLSANFCNYKFFLDNSFTDIAVDINEFNIKNEINVICCLQREKYFALIVIIFDLD